MIIKFSLVPIIFSIFTRVDAVNIFGFFIFVRGREDMPLIRHEQIHSAQWVETLWIGFLVVYLFDFIRGLFKYKNFDLAYSRVRFEQEADKYRFEETYLLNRRWYNWWKFSV